MKRHLVKGCATSQEKEHRADPTKEIFQDICFSYFPLRSLRAKAFDWSQLPRVNPENSKTKSLPTWLGSDTRCHASVTDGGKRERDSIEHDLSSATALLLSLICFLYCPWGQARWLPVEILHIYVFMSDSHSITTDTSLCFTALFFFYRYQSKRHLQTPAGAKCSHWNFNSSLRLVSTGRCLSIPALYWFQMSADHF